MMSMTTIQPFGASVDELEQLAKTLAFASAFDIKSAMTVLNPSDRQRLAEMIIARNPDKSSDVAWALQQQTDRTLAVKKYGTVWAVLGTASMAASAYHGYKRNQSVGWALWWGFCGALFPVITPVIAAAQGFGKRK